MREYKLDEDSFLTINRIVKEEIVIAPDGTRQNKVSYVEELPKEDFNLGSVKKPNKDILSFQYKKKLNPSKIFGGLFGGK